MGKPRSQNHKFRIRCAVCGRSSWLSRLKGVVVYHKMKHKDKRPTACAGSGLTAVEMIALKEVKEVLR